jgi:hypothetical protein
MPANFIPAGLAAIAGGRDHITLAEFARAINKAPQTVRKNLCLKGECYGIRSTKIGNRHNFGVADTAALLNGEVT